MANRIRKMSKRLVGVLAVATVGIAWGAKRLVNWSLRHGEGAFKWLIEEGVGSVFGLPGLGLLILFLAGTALYLKHRASSNEEVDHEENHGS